MTHECPEMLEAANNDSGPGYGPSISLIAQHTDGGWFAGCNEPVRGELDGVEYATSITFCPFCGARL